MRRRAFTLTEILVAVVIMLVLLGLTLAFYPKREVLKANDAAVQVQTFIATAKAKAMREGRPIGVRLLSDDGGLTFTRMAMVDARERYAPFDRPAYYGAPLTTYLELPSGDLIQKANQNPSPNVVGNTVRQVGVPLKDNVSVGDLLEIVEVTPSIHRIIAVDYATNTVTLAASKVQQTDGTWFVQGIPNVSCVSGTRLGWNYRYIRRSTYFPLMGEMPEQLPKGTIILGNSLSGSVPTSLNLPVDAQGNALIVFGPGGQIVNSTSSVVLWITDVDGITKPTLLAIRATTGVCEAYPVGAVGNEFQFVRDGR